ncbi:MAG: NAD(P)/FAD-dependent oxidoreductase [Candidatus Omnitrophota bacterium]|nr:NAD(P)/FAD-dependent oxidoreductase [Candidatus Omnitrophota bacterium]
MQKFDTAVIGGGAAGIVAAISARQRGREVVICEKMPRLGKKILASGAGRCNISNDCLDESHYNPEARNLVKSVFSRFGKARIEGFFNSLGLKLYSQEARVFPVTNQASSVLKVLDEELKRLKIRAEFEFEVKDITCAAKGFIVSGPGKSVSCDSVIIACGGKSYPSLGASGSGYDLAKLFEHKITEPVPSAVPLVVKDKFCHLLQGQKISCAARSIIGGKLRKEASGEVLFTKYGLSGTAILDISGDISIEINRFNRKGALVSIDMAPFIDASGLRKEVEDRISRHFAPENLMMGILPNKFSIVLKDLFKDKSAADVVSAVKDKRFDVIGTRGWNEAEFTAGGVDLKDVNPDTLESKLKKGIYFAGEVLDVNGERGGYNLAWAWASGFVAGLA